MFTGIIEELGTLRRSERGPISARLHIEAPTVTAGVHPGDSIAVNGVCLTVAEFGAGRFVADVMAETLNRSNLGELRPGDRVNLERAIRLGDRLGGHLVSGHVDGVGHIVGREPYGIALVLRILAPEAVMRYVIEKGSVAVDGISLTVVDLDHESFRVSIIPHTAELTTLGLKKAGARVNLEADMIAKYVEKMLGARRENGGKLDAGLLARHGFL
ncbi:MAG: riboflavin synthase [Candidatus Desulforudis sp.]|nr:riboflavin synthase [Desulforudis sp.]